MMRQSSKPRALVGLLSALVLAGCHQDPLSVPFDELYVPCISDEDCPREASECYTHRFYTAPNREVTVAYRQCSRSCSAHNDCRDGTLENGDDGDISVVSGLCMVQDEFGVYDRRSDSRSGHCLDVGNGFEPTLPECPTHGTMDTEIYSGLDYAQVCLPDALEE
jgi:hypothetical protein